jgi:hypothetical protein
LKIQCRRFCSGQNLQVQHVVVLKSRFIDGLEAIVEEVAHSMPILRTYP